MYLLRLWLIFFGCDAFDLFPFVVIFSEFIVKICDYFFGLCLKITVCSFLFCVNFGFLFLFYEFCLSFSALFIFYFLSTTGCHFSSVNRI